MERKLFVGDVVTLKEWMLGNEKETKGVVYEQYDIGDGPGASIIFPNGEYDGFSPKDQEDFLEKIDHCIECERYDFINVMRLNADFKKGFFAPGFSPESSIERDRRLA